VVRAFQADKGTAYHGRSLQLQVDTQWGFAG